MRYALERKKQRLHLVEEVDQEIYGSPVRSVALCGKEAKNGWQLTINVPLSNVCKKCELKRLRGVLMNADIQVKYCLNINSVTGKRCGKVAKYECRCGGIHPSEVDGCAIKPEEDLITDHPILLCEDCFPHYEEQMP